MTEPIRANRFVLVIAAVFLLTSPLAAGQRTATKTWKVPRTPDGQPDLQGVWLSRTATPLERPAALKDKASLTDQEVADLKARATRLFNDGHSDFASADAVFLAALSDRERFTASTSTHGSEDMIERTFDHHTSLVIDPPDGLIPPLTSAARARRETRLAAAQRIEGPEGLDSANRCLAWSTPRLGGRYGAGDLGYYQIVQSPGFVVLFMETGHEARIIPLNRDPRLPHLAGQWSGQSRGHWEGATLVVDTTGFSAKSNFMGASDHLHLTERFTRVSNDAITYQITLDDPTTWTRSWTAEMPLERRDEMLYESACHEGNERIMEGLLGAARLQP